MASPVGEPVDKKNLATDSDTVLVDADEKSSHGNLEEEIVQPHSPPTPEQLKEENPSGKGKENKGENNIKSALVISGVVIAVIGAIFALVKKVKEA